MTNKAVYSIFPAIGVARVGNAPKAYYIGPEEYRGLPIKPDGKKFLPEDFRDENKLMARQAARFKIYRTEDGKAEEIVVGTKIGDVKVTKIVWTVHLANKKASWFQFDPKIGENGYPSNQPMRNSRISAPEERQKRLIIDAGPRTVGDGASTAAFTAETAGQYPATFPPRGLKPKDENQPGGNDIVTLGDLMLDPEGRLLVLGGHGHAGTTELKPELSTFANNDHWWDDTSDGPVTAEIHLEGGKKIAPESAWVLVAPPSYAPQIPNLVTLYDTIFDIVVRKQGARPDIFDNGFWKSGARGYRPHYQTEIRPILERGDTYRWVAAIPPKPHTFNYELLGDTDPELNAFRSYFLDALRPPNSENVLVNTTTGVTMMPYLAGDDALSAEAPGTTTAATSKYLRLTDTQYFMLSQWAAGHFKRDPAPSEHLGEALTRAVLENCVGGAFSPGIEMTWISREPAIYAAPFRIRVRPNPSAPLDPGYAPERGMEPGDITRYMAMPWHADFNECSAQKILGRYLWWWPAQRPEFVHIDAAPTPNKEKAGDQQVAWIGTDYDQNAESYISFADNLEMVENWWKLGFVYGKKAEVSIPEVKPTTRYVLVSNILRTQPGGNDGTTPKKG